MFEQIYDMNLSQGKIKILDIVDTNRIKVLVADAACKWQMGKELCSTSKSINGSRNGNRGGSAPKSDTGIIFSNYASAITEYTQALLLLQKMECTDTETLFAALCIKYRHLELDWSFLEGMRVKHEDNTTPTYSEWKLLRLRLEMCISVLKEEVEKIEVVHQS